MHRVVTATYQNGVLKPAQELPLHDQQQVLIIILPSPQTRPPAEPNLERVATLREQANQWLSQQSPDAVRPPLHLEQAQEQALDDSFEAALAEIRARASQFSAEEIVADVEAALAEVRTLSPDDRARLDAELNAVLAEWAADVN
jgi:predicted DNA-binding antitoxin AbrB/MazE fold protein